ncbi:unnamed protein product, partial [Nesidiocoris tenuis]
MSNNNNLPKIRADPPPWITLSITSSNCSRAAVAAENENHRGITQSPPVIFTGVLLSSDR